MIGNLEFQNILLVHSGSESAASRSRNSVNSSIGVEARIMEDFGHQVTRLAVGHPGDLNAPSSAVSPSLEDQERRKFADLMKLELFHLIHFHHASPPVHPGVLAAALASGKIVVQTLHVPLPLASEPLAPVVVGGEGSDTNLKQTGRLDPRFLVDMFILPNAALRPSLIQAGVGSDHIGIKPYALPSDPGVGNGRAGYALYVGSIDTESGVDRMLDAFTQADVHVPLKIVGTGPIQAACVAASRKWPHVQYLGSQVRPRVIELMKDASMLVMPVPSGSSLTLLEAMATGLPVLSFDTPDASTIIEPHITGILAAPDQLGARAASLILDKTAIAALRRSARAHFLANHTPRKCHDVLIDLYHRASANRRHRN